MKVKGLVKNAATQAPVARVKVVLAVGDRELAVLFSDREGRFEYMEEKEYIGQKLNCRVEKDGFEIWEKQFEVKAEEHEIQVALNPKAIGLQIRITDQKGNSLEGAKINLKSNNTSIWKGVSDSSGESFVSIDRKYRDSVLNFTVENKGFNQATGTLSIEQDKLLKIKMSEIKKHERNWIWMVVKLFIAVVLLVIGLVIIIEENEPWGFLFIIVSILTIIFGFLKNVFKRLFSRKKGSKSQIIGTVIAKNPSSQFRGSGFLVIKDTSGDRMNINIEVSVFETVRIGDTVSFKKPKKSNKIIKNLKVVTPSG